MLANLLPHFPATREAVPYWLMFGSAALGGIIVGSVRPTKIWQRLPQDEKSDADSA